MPHAEAGWMPPTSGGRPGFVRDASHNGLEEDRGLQGAPGPAHPGRSRGPGSPGSSLTLIGLPATPTVSVRPTPQRWVCRWGARGAPRAVRRCPGPAWTLGLSCSGPGPLSSAGVTGFLVRPVPTTPRVSPCAEWTLISPACLWPGSGQACILSGPRVSRPGSRSSVSRGGARTSVHFNLHTWVCAPQAWHQGFRQGWRAPMCRWAGRTTHGPRPGTWLSWGLLSASRGTDGSVSGGPSLGGRQGMTPPRRWLGGWSQVPGLSEDTMSE